MSPGRKKNMLKPTAEFELKLMLNARYKSDPWFVIDFLGSAEEQGQMTRAQVTDWLRSFCANQFPIEWSGYIKVKTK